MAETLTAPIEDKIEFVTLADAQKLSKMMTKDWVKAGPDGKPTKSKEFIYRILSSHPYEKAGTINPVGKSPMILEVQKFYRNKFTTKKTMIGGQQQAEKENLKVDQHTYNDVSGVFDNVDEEANQMIDFHKFVREFAADAQE